MSIQKDQHLKRVYTTCVYWEALETRVSFVFYIMGQIYIS